MTNKKLNQKEFCELTREEQFKADIARKDELIENRDQMLAKKDKIISEIKSEKDKEISEIKFEYEKIKIKKDIQIAIRDAAIILLKIMLANQKKICELQEEMLRLYSLLKYQKKLINRLG